MKRNEPTASNIIIPGYNIRLGWFLKNVLLSCIIFPHSDILGCTPIPKNEKEANDKYKDFVNRVASIKRDTEREEVLRVVSKFLGCVPSKEKENVDLDIKKMLGESLDQDSNSENARLYSLLCQLTDEKEVNAHISSLWGELMLELLANQKYLKKFN